MAAFRYQEAQPNHEARKAVREDTIESGFIGKLQGLKHEPSGARQTGRKASPQETCGGADQYRPDITNCARTFHFANNNARHFAFNAYTAMRGSTIPSREASLRSLSAAKDDRFLPVYEFADEDNSREEFSQDIKSNLAMHNDVGAREITVVNSQRFENDPDVVKSTVGSCQVIARLKGQVRN